MGKIASKIKLVDKDDLEINPATNEKLDEVITAIENSSGGGGPAGSVGIKDEADVRMTPSKETTQVTLRGLLEGIFEAVQGIRVLGAVRGILADLRVSVVNTPNVGTVTTVTTVTTTTTVGTVTNQAQMGGYLANPQIPALMNMVAVQSNINNLKIT